MTLRPEQIRAQEYLHQKGTLLPAAQIHDRVGAAFAAMDALLAGVSEAEARARPIPSEWTVQEVVDHLVETHRPSLEELRDLLADRRPRGGPIPAALQSPAAMDRRYADLARSLSALHREILGVLAAAPDRPTAARAPVVMVINAREADGREVPLHWIEALDWKAYAVIFRLHELDHLGQVKKLLKAARAAPSAPAPRDPE
jgi:DinB superfamily